MSAAPDMPDHASTSPEFAQSESEGPSDEERAFLNRRIIGSTVVLADAANVFLQLGWPEVGYGVLESTVTSGQVMKHPFKRARTTITYLGVALLGTPEQVAAYRLAVNQSHRPVHSGPKSPVKYNAFDPELQLWVASCLFYGTWDMTTRAFGPMATHEEEMLLRAGARFGTSLQMSADQWHTSMREFWDYWEAGTRRIVIDENVGAYFLDLLYLRMLPSPVSATLGRLHAWFNTGFTPPFVRDQLGLTWTEADDARLARIMRALGVVSRLQPRALRHFPVNLMVRATFIRRRLGKSMV